MLKPFKGSLGIAVVGRICPTITATPNEPLQRCARIKGERLLVILSSENTEEMASHLRKSAKICG
jgi:hypothetical protein